METQTLLIGISFVVCAILASCFFAIVNKRHFEDKKLLSATLVIVSSFVLTAGSLSFFFWNPYDFIADIQFFHYFVFLLSLLFITASFFINVPYIVALAVLAASFATVFTSDITISFSSLLPQFLNQLLTVAILWVFAMGFRSTTSLNTLSQLEASTVCCGLLLLYFLGSAPFILGLNAATLLGALLISYLYQHTHPVSYPAAPALGFILGWFGLIAYQEYIGSCFIIFVMLYLIELVVCTARKLSFLQKYSQLAHNSLIIQARNDEIPTTILIRAILNICLISIVLGVLQIFSQAGSLIIFSFVLISWMLYRVVFWRDINKTFKESNQEVISQIKQNFNAAFNSHKSKNKSDKDS